MTKYIVMVFAGACSYGMLSTFVKLAYHEGHSTAWIAVSQALMGMAALWIWAWISDRRRPQPVRAHHWQPVIAAGGAIGLTTYVYYLSVHYIPASLAIVLLMQFTWMSLLLEWILSGTSPRGRQLITVGLILLGTVMAGNLGPAHLDRRFLTGTGYALLSALLYAVYIIANSRLGNGMPVPRKSALIMTGFTLGVVMVNARELLMGLPVQPGLLKWSLFLAVFGTIIPPVLFAKGIPKIGAGLSAVIMTAELPVAVLCAHGLLGEPVTGLQWAGVVLMLLAIVWMNSRPGKGA